MSQAVSKDNNIVDNKIVRLQPSRMPIAKDIANEYGITAPDWRVLTEQIFPSAKSPEAIFMALSYCKKRNLDIFKKPVHIVPMYSSAKKAMVETVWPGISEIRTTATRTGSYAGISEAEFGPIITKKFTKINQDQGGNEVVGFTKEVSFPEWCRITVFRIVKGQKCEFHAKVYWLEAYASLSKSDVPNEMWTRRAFGQLEKVTEAAALRKAFPEEVGNDYAAEEMDGRALVIDEQITIEPVKKVAPPPPKKPIEAKAIEVEQEELSLAQFFEEFEAAISQVNSRDDIEQIIADMDVERICANDMDVIEKITQRRIDQLESI